LASEEDEGEESGDQGADEDDSDDAYSLHGTCSSVGYGDDSEKVYW